MQHTHLSVTHLYNTITVHSYGVSQLWVERVGVSQLSVEGIIDMHAWVLHNIMGKFHMHIDISVSSKQKTYNQL